jgi:ABC-type nitrate/sulfonate/bicarbonate transport system substrate-binding protein
MQHAPPRRPRRPRRVLVALFLALSVLTTACGAFGDQEAGAAGGRERSILQIGLPTGVTSFANADLIVAQEMGFLADYGIAAELQNLRSGVSVVQGVVGGALDVGASSIEPVVNAAGGGGDIVIIGSSSDRLAVSAVTPTSIRTPEELRGHQLGVQEVGAFREVMTRLVLQQGGLTPDDVQYVPVDAQSYTSALVDGRIQSAILQTEQAIAAVNSNPGLHVLANFADILPNYHYGTFFVSRSWLEANRDTATRLLTAITRAHRFMYDNKDETVRIVAEATGFDESVIAEAYDVLIVQQQIFPMNTGLDPNRIRATVEQMRVLGILQNEPPAVDRLVDPGPAQDAIVQLGQRAGTRG